VLMMQGKGNAPHFVQHNIDAAKKERLAMY
jgi:hypothetical protein